jgi:hypothetical protein
MPAVQTVCALQPVDKKACAITRTNFIAQKAKNMIFSRSFQVSLVVFGLPRLTLARFAHLALVEIVHHHTRCTQISSVRNQKASLSLGF